MSEVKEIPESDKPFYVTLVLLASYALVGVAVVVRFPDYFKDYLASLTNFVALAVGYYLGSKTG